jgi:Ca-activated chloride channel homolog
MTFRFMYPEILLMLVTIPVLVAGWLFARAPVARIRFSYTAIWKTIPGAVSVRPVWIPRILRILGLFLLIIAAARPQSGEHEEVIKSKGVDIVIALDISGSMRALDFQPDNRLEVAKRVMQNFIGKRENDRIGLVLFGSESFTLCPLTLDHDLLLEFLSQAQIGMVEEQTAIGKAIANAVNRLRITSDQDENKTVPEKGNEKLSESQIVILVTDGVNNINSKMDPITAAKAAAAMGIKIYTIGVGTNGYVDFPHPRFPNHTVKVQVELDEGTLKEIAKLTGGQYFQAVNSEALQKIFDIIDNLEKIEIESLKYTRYSELFIYPLVMAFLILCSEIILRQTRYRRFP